MSMSSWCKDLCDAVEKDDLAAVKSILATDEFKRHRHYLRRKERVAWSTRSPLHLAAWLGRNEMVRALVEEAGLEVNSFCSYDKMTVLRSAVWADRADTVRLLLDLGADVSDRGQWLKSYCPGIFQEYSRKGAGTNAIRVLDEHEAWLSFRSLDPMSKLLRKPNVVQDVEEAERIKTEIEESTEKRKEVEKDLKRLKEEVEEKEAQSKTLEEKVEGMRRQSGYRHCRDLLRSQLEEIETIETSLKQILHERVCSVCSVVVPRQVFVCQECDNWVCQDCREEEEEGEDRVVVVVKICAKCRVDLTVKPMVRCRAIEKVLGIN